MSFRRAVLSQVLDLVHRETLDRLGARYDAHQRVRHFGLRQQLICMVFAQLTWREGLRDIEHCFNAKPEMLYHLGFREPVARSTLADANEKRDWRIWEALGKSLISKAQKLYEGEELGLDLSNAIYALDSTTIDLSLTLFPWADFRSTKAGVKIHTQLDLRGSIPTCIHVTDARQHDVLWLDDIEFEATSFYVMDRGYVDYGRLGRIADSGAFFVTRAKDNLRFSRHESLPVDRSTGIHSDQVGKLWSKAAQQKYGHKLRRVNYHDPEDGRWIVFLTNNLDIPAITVARIYKMRWQIELFFKWLKGHLRIKHYYGTTPNAVKTQIWIAMCVYLLVAILHKQLRLPGTLHRTLQILSVHPFEKVPIHELLTQEVSRKFYSEDCNQLLLFDL